MHDAKVLTGTFATASSAVAGWIEVLQPVASFAVTLIVGGLTAWYTWERADKLRKERKRSKNEENTQ